MSVPVRIAAALLLALACLPASSGAARAHPPDEDEPRRPPPPPDWTQVEKEHWALLEKELAQVVKLMNEKCETTVSASFDKETFRGHLIETGKTGLAASRWWQNASESLGTLRNLCIATPTSKAAVKSKVGKVVIQHAGAGRSHGLAASTLTAVVDEAVAPREWQTKYEQFVKSKL
jgi:hypothetical protein